jgi:hypothetical protein
MAKRGRPPSGVPHRSIELWLPVALLHEIEIYLPRDSLSGKTKHGAWSTYFAQLARADLGKRAQFSQQGAEHVQD